MLATDNESEARRFAASLGEGAASHFYDPDRRVGIAYAGDYFQDLMRETLTALPNESPYRERLVKQLNAPARQHPLWDAVLIFPPGAEWHAPPPRPDWWARQVGFFGTDAADGHTGLIWKSPGRQPPIESDWFFELREARRRMSRGAQPNTSLP